jgi:hypothetical protein
MNMLNKKIRTTMFLGEDDHAIIAKILAALNSYGVDNKSQAVRVALRFWQEHHPTPSMTEPTVMPVAEN